MLGTSGPFTKRGCGTTHRDRHSDEREDCEDRENSVGCDDCERHRCGFEIEAKSNNC
jgi:hypothetical protein